MSAFHNETKYCPCCDTHVRFLASIEFSYCVECGGEVRLFSKDEWQAVQQILADRKPKGGRPRKGAGRRGKRATQAA